MRKYDGNGESSPRETDAVAATMGPLYSPSIHYTLLLYIIHYFYTFILFFYIILRFYTLYSFSTLFSPSIHFTLSLHTLLKLSSSLHHTQFTTLHYTPISNEKPMHNCQQVYKNEIVSHCTKYTCVCATRVGRVCHLLVFGTHDQIDAPTHHCFLNHRCITVNT